MPRKYSLLEGRNRLISEIQMLFEVVTNKYLAKKKSQEILDKIFDIIFDEVFRFGRFVLPNGYGKIYIKKYRRKMFPDREYKMYSPNYEDDTGTYYVTFVLRYQPGVRAKERLRQYKGQAIGPKSDSVNDDFMKILEYFTE